MTSLPLRLMFIVCLPLTFPPFNQRPRLPTVCGLHQLQGDDADVSLRTLRRMSQVLHQDHPDDCGAAGAPPQVSLVRKSSVSQFLLNVMTVAQRALRLRSVRCLSVCQISAHFHDGGAAGVSPQVSWLCQSVRFLLNQSQMLKS